MHVYNFDDNIIVWHLGNYLIMEKRATQNFTTSCEILYFIDCLLKNYIGFL